MAYIINHKNFLTRFSITTNTYAKFKQYQNKKRRVLQSLHQNQFKVFHLKRVKDPRVAILICLIV